MHFAAGETGVAEHLLEFGERVRVAARCAAEHLLAERRSLWRRHAIVVRHKFQCHGAATGFQGCVNLPQKRLTSVWIEVVQKICEQHEVIVSPIIDIERTARLCLVAILNAGSHGILLRDF